MDEIIQLTSFTFDVTKLTKDIAEAEKRLFDLKQAQQEVSQQGKKLEKDSKLLSDAMEKVSKTSGEESEQFQDLKKQLEALTKEQQKNYSEGLKLTRERQESTKEYKNLISLQSIATKQLIEETQSNDENVRTIQRAIEENRTLTQQRKNINTETEEGAKAIALINAKIDENNAYIKSNVSSLEQQRLNVGAYKDSILQAHEELENQKKALLEQEKTLVSLRDETDKGSKEWNIYNNQLNQVNVQINVLNEKMGETAKEVDGLNIGTDILNGNFLSLVKGSEEVGGAQNLLAGGLKNATSGMMGLVRASLAFLATPVGAVIGALVVTIGLLVNAFNRNEESADKVNGIMTKMGAIIGTVLGKLEPLGNFLVDVLVKAFDWATMAVQGYLFVMEKISDFLGFEGISESIKDIRVGFNEATISANKLAEAERNIVASNRELKKFTAENIVEMERLKNIMDDTTKSLSQREKASEKLSSTIKQQSNLEKSIAQQELLLIQERIKVSGRKTELIDAEIEAIAKLNTIEADALNKEREALTKRNDLRKQAHDAYIKQVDERIKKDREALELFIAEQGYREKSIEDNLSLQEQVAQKSIDILKSELSAKKISLEKYNADVLNIQNELAKKQAEASITIANHELEIFKANAKAKLQQDGLFTLEQFNARVNLENELNTQALEIERQRFEAGLITQREFDSISINLLNERLATEKSLKDSYKQQERESDLLNRTLQHEEDLLLLQEKNASDFELRLEQLSFEYEEEKNILNQQKADGLISEENYLKANSNLEKQYSLTSIELKKQEENAKLGLVGSAFGAIASMMGENSKLGKSLALAQALINTYQGITAGVALGFPAMIPAIAMASATGFSAVANITKTKTPKAEKGGVFRVGGSRHSAGGTNYYGDDGNMFNAEKGEAIGILNRGATRAFMDFNDSFYQNSSGTALMQESLTNGNQTNEILASVIGEAVREGAMIGSSEGTYEGTVQSSENSQVRLNSTF